MDKEKIRKFAEDMLKTDCECGADIDSDHQVQQCAWHEVLLMLDEPEAGEKAELIKVIASLDTQLKEEVKQHEEIREQMRVEFVAREKALTAKAPDDRVKALVEAGALEVLKAWGESAYPKPANAKQNLELMASRYAETALKAVQGEGQ